MEPLREAIDAEVERTGFTGVVRLDRHGEAALCEAYGHADRAHGVHNAVDTMFALASGSKVMTATAIMSLVETGTLGLATTARSLLGKDLPLIADGVTVEHLLAHRSGIGDYLDEEALDDIRDYVMPVPVHELATTEQYLPVLDGHPTVFAAGDRFAYNNGGYVVLALLAERASGVGFHELVQALVCEPAGMASTAFLRSDELPGHAARGYLSADGLRTNVFHLPVRGSGDGGIYSTAADLSAFWAALFAGDIVSQQSVSVMVGVRSECPGESMRFGLGLYLSGAHDAVWLDGHDAGVSMISLHRPSTSTTCTVISNWSEGAWPIFELLDRTLE